MTAFKKWYAKHGDTLAQVRRERYKNDPEYRAKALLNSRKNREKRKQAQEPKPAAYSVSLTEAAESLDVDPSFLRAMPSKHWCPGFLLYGGRYWVTPHQVELLGTLCSMWNTFGRHKSEGQKKLFADLIALTFVNWS